MEVVIPLSTFLKVQNRVSDPRHEFLHFSIFCQKIIQNDKIFGQKVKNVQTHVLDLKFYYALLGKWKGVLKLPLPIIYGPDIVFLDTTVANMSSVSGDWTPVTVKTVTFPMTCRKNVLKGPLIFQKHSGHNFEPFRKKNSENFFSTFQPFSLPSTAEKSVFEHILESSRHQNSQCL